MDFVFAHQNGIDVHGDAFCCDTFPACWSTDLISTGQTHSSLSLSFPLALALAHTLTEQQVKLLKRVHR